MGFFRKLFCIGNDANRDGEWVVARNSYVQTQNLYAKARFLELAEKEVNAVFRRLQYKRMPADPASLRRLHEANLPLEDAQAAIILLEQLASIEISSKQVEKERNKLLKALDAAEAARRQAEFSKAKAEALATARGEALMQAQAKVRDAEAQQIQLSDMLKRALSQLGVEISQNNTVSTMNSSITVADMSQTEPLSVEDFEESAAAAASQPRASDGFTVYTNELHSASEGDNNNVSRKQQSNARTTSSGAARRSNNNNKGAKPVPQRHPGNNSRSMPSEFVASSSGLVSQEPPASRDRYTTPEPEDEQERQAHSEAQRLAQLVVPHLDTEQLESLVRIGASLQSPEMSYLIQEELAKARKQHEIPQPPQVPAGTWVSPSAADKARGRRSPAASPQPHIKTVMNNSDYQEFYHPFSSGMVTAQQQREAKHGAVANSNTTSPNANSIRDANSQPSSPRVLKATSKPRSRQPSPVRRSTFSISSATGSAPNSPPKTSTFSLAQHAVPAPGPVRPPHSALNPRPLRTAAAANNDEDAVERQRRAAERLRQKLAERQEAYDRSRSSSPAKKKPFRDANKSNGVVRPH